MRVLKSISPQPLTGLVALALGAVALGASWLAMPTVPVEPSLWFVGALLVIWVLSAARFSIHLRNNTKLMIITLPLYLLTVVLPLPLAVSVVAFAVLGNALLMRPFTGNYPIDIATAVGRWTVTAWLGSSIAHLPAAGMMGWLGQLVLAAALMFLCDIVGTAFEVSAMSGEPPRHLMRVLIRALALPEGVQYLFGIAGALALERDLITLGFFGLFGLIVYVVFKRANELQDGTRQLLEDMADTIDLRDSYTGGHSRRVTESCRKILEALHLTGVEVDLILAAARVHDIGKIGVPDEILLKPGKLTPAERRIMESHVEIGARLLRQYHDFARGKEIVLHHHEHWDGSGYPGGLKGMEIPLGARIVAVADSFDAMTSDRPYRSAFRVEQALDLLEKGSGTQWDPRIVSVFVELTRASLAAPVQASPRNLAPDSLSSAA